MCLLGVELPLIPSAMTENYATHCFSANRHGDLVLIFSTFCYERGRTRPRWGSGGRLNEYLHSDTKVRFTPDTPEQIVTKKEMR